MNTSNTPEKKNLGQWLRAFFADEWTLIRKSYPDSLKELKNTRSLALCGMLIAMQIVLGMVASVSIGQVIRISFNFLAVAVTGMLFGPVPAMLCGAIADIILCIIRPMGPYFPGFTLTAALGGMTYGMFFYHRKINLAHIVIAKLIVNVVVNVLLNSINLQILYGNITPLILVDRIVTNVVKLPVDIILLSMLLIPVHGIIRRVNLGQFKT